MTDDAELTAEEARATLSYPCYRAWWAANVTGKPYGKRRPSSRIIRPLPGVLDVAAEDDG